MVILLSWIILIQIEQKQTVLQHLHYHGTIGGFSTATVTTISNAANGGSLPESISSIKYNAPRDYTAQDRAVTADDYKVLVKSLYANAQAVQVYGGEDAAIPDYGKVYISIKAKSGSNLTEQQKASIVKVLNNMLLLL